MQAYLIHGAVVLAARTKRRKITKPCQRKYEGVFCKEECMMYKSITIKIKRYSSAQKQTEYFNYMDDLLPWS